MALAISLMSAFVWSLSSCASSKNDAVVEQPTVSETQPSVQPLSQSVPTTLFETKKVGDDRQVRVVEKPTLAALDFAAYYNNPSRLAGKDEKPENYTGKMAAVTVAEYPFPMLSSVSESEPAVVARRAPLAWEPLSKILYAQVGNDSLGALLNAISISEGLKQNESKLANYLK